ncbi:hypothetical protein H9P43_000176 [Blastocladiella emersonii ATCC 22665]|nr:hypothetical protein H9P43_000176 [Blastocladiella emersonii ATCC 22665]
MKTRTAVSQQPARAERVGKASELEAEFKAIDKTGKHAKKKDVLKRVIAGMTMGTDMSSLCHHVILCASLPGVDVKKMIYLYIVQYAKSLPDLATLAVNLLFKDTRDANPLTRAQALRTMGYICTPEMTESLVSALGAALKDDDAFVRKTAVMCINKLYVHDASLCEREGLLDALRDMVLDPNGAVMACALAVMREIGESHPAVNLHIDVNHASKLLTAINECSEWYQVYILEALMFVVPQSPEDAILLAERLAARLQHANAAVSLTVIRVLLHLLTFLPAGVPQYADFTRAMVAKLAPPLVTLMSRGPEIQFTALRNIILIVEAHPALLQAEIAVFFCKYNDPIYVKLAKLEVLIRIVNEKNCPQVLAELKEYASEVDVDFVRRAVKYIGRCAILHEPMADACIAALQDLIATKVSYVLQEAVVVIRDVFRRYPNRYEGLLGALTEQLDAIDEPDAKAAYIWILGHYAARIDGACDALQLFTKDLLLDPPNVQLALLGAVAKALVHRVPGSPALFRAVSDHLIAHVDHPDVRDRAVMLQRAMAQGEAVARALLTADRPAVSLKSDAIPPHLLAELMLHLGALASILHRPPAAFLGSAAPKKGQPPGPNGGMTASASAGATSDQPRALAPRYDEASDVINASTHRVLNLLDMDGGGAGAESGVAENSGGGFFNALMGGGGRSSPTPSSNPFASPTSGAAAAADRRESLGATGLLSSSPSQTSGMQHQQHSPAYGAGLISPSASSYQMTGGMQPASGAVSASPSYGQNLSLLGSGTGVPHSGTSSSLRGIAPSQDLGSPSMFHGVQVPSTGAPIPWAPHQQQQQQQHGFGMGVGGTTSVSATASAGPSLAQGSPYRAPGMVLPQQQAPRPGGSPAAMPDLLGSGDASPASAPLSGRVSPGLTSLATTSVPGLTSDLAGLALASPLPAEPQEVWLNETNGKGFEIAGAVVRDPMAASNPTASGLALSLKLTNKTMSVLDHFAIKLNGNVFGFQAGAMPVQSLARSASATVTVPLLRSGTAPPNLAALSDEIRGVPLHIQAAMRTSAQIHYFLVPVPLHLVLVPGAVRGSFSDFMVSGWFDRGASTPQTVAKASTAMPGTVYNKLCACGMEVVAVRTAADGSTRTVLVAGKLMANDLGVAVELTSPVVGGGGFYFRVAAQDPTLVPPVVEYVGKLVMSL